MATPEGRVPTILVIDDSTENRYVVRRALTRAGMVVMEAETGAEGQARAEDGPDLVVLDVNLPDISGFEVCRRLKSDPRTSHLPVIHLSQSSIDPDARVRGLEGGADAYLTEPIHGSVLVATVRALLRMRHAEDELRRQAADADRQAALNIRLARARSESEVIRALLEVTGARFPVRRAYRLGPRPWTVPPALIFPPGSSEAEADPFPLGLREIDAHLSQLVVRERFGDPRIAYFQSRGRDLAILPFVAFSRELGTLLIEFADGVRVPERYQRRLAVSGERSAQAIERIRLFESQRRIAGELQASLLPARLPQIPGIELAADYRPGAEEMLVGGDFYDVFPSHHGWVAIVGDVLGRGAAAAARTALVRHTAREAARHDDDPAAILAAVAAAMAADAHEDQLDLISAVCLTLRPGADPSDGHEVAISLAGHPLPLHLAGGEVRPVGRPGPILGIDTGVAFTTSVMRLGPGEALMLYTDGVTESRAGGILFGEPRLTALLTELLARDAEVAELASAPIQAAARFNEHHDDDMATLVLRAQSPASSPRSSAEA